MAGGKETPRQKMIGMMYLVLTCLLAMNVSKDILAGFVTVNNSLERTNSNFTSSTDNIMKGFKAALEKEPAGQFYFQRAMMVRDYSKELIAYIDNLKKHVTAKTSKNPGYMDSTNWNLKYVDAKDNYDIPTHELIGNETNPSKGANSAFELKSKLNTYHDKILQIFEKGGKKFLQADIQEVKTKIQGIVPSVGKEDTEHGVPVTWENKNFNHMPLAAVITYLTKLQTDVKNTEAEMVSKLYASVGATSFKFDKLSAKVIAPSSYIQAGQPYTADVLLVASSSTASPKIFLGTYDTVGRKWINKGSELKVELGMGKVSMPTGGAGEQRYSGGIEMVKPTGEVEVYPFEGTYMVAAPSVAVSADKMNVIYIGVPNPISVSAAGIAPSELQVSGSGISLAPAGPGKYIATATTPGEASISVSAKTKDGVKSQGPPVKFRVKPIPPPVAKAGGMTGTATMGVNQVKAIGGIGAELAGFDFDAKFVVTSFEFTATVKGKGIQEVSNSNNLTPGMVAAIQGAVAGTRIFISEVKAKGPDGRIQSIPGVTIKVK
jgi:gliding motility-associated protein GldM